MRSEIKHVNNSSKGASHIKSGKPCQDASYSYSCKRLSIAIVSDGHGGDKYFRSHIGSRLLCNITANEIKCFVENAESKPFMMNHIVGYSMEEALKDPHKTESLGHKMLMRLFSSIICKWNNAIEKDALDNDILPEEKLYVSPELQDAFRTKRNAANRTSGFEKIYGCTLIAYFQTPNYWVAFQIGDGKLVTFNIKNNKLLIDQPIPWDKRCFLNKTTSICDSIALEEFRYCYGRRNTQPMAVFLGSDGIDDTFGDGDNLYDFYLNLCKEIINGNMRSIDNLLKDEMPNISRIGSQDDMSVAGVFDKALLKSNRNVIINWQMALKEREIEGLREMISERNDIINPLLSSGSLSISQQANLTIAQKEKLRFENKIALLQTKIRELNNEKSH